MGIVFLGQEALRFAFVFSDNCRMSATLGRARLNSFSSRLFFMIVVAFCDSSFLSLRIDRLRFIENFP